jgi:hypothetical protein
VVKRNRRLAELAPRAIEGNEHRLRIATAFASLALVTASTVTSVAAADSAGAAGSFELRAGGEVEPRQSIVGFRDYSLAEDGSTYGGYVAGLANATGKLWLGTSVSFAGLDAANRGYSPYGSIGGWILHWPVLVELGFPTSMSGSRAIAGLELGAIWGKLTNVYSGALTDPTVSLGGYYFGLRGGYVVPIAGDLAFGALLGIRGGAVDQTDDTPLEAYTNDGLIYLSLACQVGLHFRP